MGSTFEVGREQAREDSCRKDRRMKIYGDDGEGRWRVSVEAEATADPCHNTVELVLNMSSTFRKITVYLVNILKDSRQLMK